MSNAERFPHPWEQMPNESRKAFRAFRAYCDLSPEKRSIPAVADLLGYRTCDYRRRKGLGPSQLEAWSARFHWRERSKYSDVEREREFRESQAIARIEMAKRHVAVAMLLQAKAVQRLQKVDADALDEDRARRWLIEGVKMERLARGESDEPIQPDADDWMESMINLEVTRRIREHPLGHEIMKNQIEEDYRVMRTMAENTPVSPPDYPCTPKNT